MSAASDALTTLAAAQTEADLLRRLLAQDQAAYLAAVANYNNYVPVYAAARRDYLAKKSAADVAFGLLTDDTLLLAAPQYQQARDAAGVVTACYNAIAQLQANVTSCSGQLTLDQQALDTSLASLAAARAAAAAVLTNADSRAIGASYLATPNPPPEFLAVIP